MMPELRFLTVRLRGCRCSSLTIHRPEDPDHCPPTLERPPGPVEYRRTGRSGYQRFLQPAQGWSRGRWVGAQPLVGPTTYCTAALVVVVVVVRLGWVCLPGRWATGGGVVVLSMRPSDEASLTTPPSRRCGVIQSTVKNKKKVLLYPLN